MKVAADCGVPPYARNYTQSNLGLTTNRKLHLPRPTQTHCTLYTLQNAALRLRPYDCGHTRGTQALHAQQIAALRVPRSADHCAGRCAGAALRAALHARRPHAAQAAQAIRAHMLRRASAHTARTRARTAQNHI